MPTVFSEPQVDFAYDELPEEPARPFAVEALPGQFDQRAASAAECVQLISQGERPTVRPAKVYLLSGDLSTEDFDAIKGYVVTGRSRLAELERPRPSPRRFPTPSWSRSSTASARWTRPPSPPSSPSAVLPWTRPTSRSASSTSRMRTRPHHHRDRVIDTYWSDHCRHTTFGTNLENIEIDDAAVEAAFNRYMEMRHELGRDEKPVCLMDMGTIGAKWLRSRDPHQPR
ncbi:MAG: hypothetical protein ACLTKG_02755 [Collinsella intestinalis]